MRDGCGFSWPSPFNEESISTSDDESVVDRRQDPLSALTEFHEKVRLFVYLGKIHR